MAPAFKLAVLSALASAVVANPLPAAHKGAFTLEQVAVQRSTPKNGAITLASTFAKYGAAVPENVAAAAAAAVTGSVVATPGEYDELYLIPVTVGSTVLNLDLDTGSADL